MKLRALLPSWQFFDHAAPSPQLLVEVNGSWRAPVIPRRRWWTWAFAPASNLALAYQSTVEHLVAEVAELDPATDHDAPAITGLVEYALVQRIAREQAGGPCNWKIVHDGDDYLLGKTP